MLGETRWLAEQGVKEIMLVSENNTSYGKDLGDIRLLETLLPELAAVDGIERVRVSYLQPAEMRPGLIDVLTSTPKVAPYFDLSFQHSAPGVLRAMRRFGDTDRFLELLETIRGKAPAGRRALQLHRRLPRRERGRPRRAGALPERARGWTPSASSGTPTRRAPRPPATRTSWTRTWSPSGWRSVSRLAEELTAQRAEERVGETVHVLVESDRRRARARAGPGRAPGARDRRPGCSSPIGDGLGAGRMVEAKVVGRRESTWWPEPLAPLVYVRRRRR